MNDAQLLQVIEANYVPGQLSALYINAVEEYARRDPEKALERFFGKERISDFAGFGTTAVSLSKSNPEALKTWLTETLPTLTKNKELLGVYYGQGLAALAKADPAGALALADSSISDSTVKMGARDVVFRMLGGMDPEKALGMARAGYSGKDLDRILSSLAMGAVAEHPEKALEIVGALTSASDRSSSGAMVLRAWLAQDREAALNKLAGLPAADFEKIAKNDLSGDSSMIAALAADRPELLIQKLESIVPSSANLELFEKSVGALMAKDQTKALSVISALPKSNMKKQLFESAYAALAESHPSASVLKELDAQDPDLKASAVRGFASTIGQSGMKSVLEISKDLPSGDRGVFLSEAISSVNESDLNQAADLFVQKDPMLSDLSAAQRSSLLKSMGERMAIADPDETLQWFSKIPAESQADAMRGMSREMIRNDVYQFSDWLTNQPHNDAWKEGAKALVRELNFTDPAMAAKWKAAIDPGSK